MRKLYTITRRPQVLFLFCLLALSLAAVNPPPLITQLRESVVTIYGYDRDGNRSMGTGWLISDRQVVTCFHVVDGNQRLEAMASDHRMIPVIGVAVADKTGDIAILTIPPQPNIPPLTLAPGLPQAGERVYVLSTPHGLDSNLGEQVVSSSPQVEGVNHVHTPISVGVVSAIKRVGGVNIVQFTAPITHGCSGSPLVNERGEVVAVVQSMSGPGEYFGVEAGRVGLNLSSPAPRQTNPSNRPIPGLANGGIFEHANGNHAPRPQPRSTPQPQPPQPRPSSENGKAYENK